ncbi:MAG: acyltransferase [Gammaproteobacteria bacterium]|nr:acyltransferase [Gammaproteobacteria bacterium]MDH5652378.1 acyltransferase [Gammaproteobacteria bacterium]
MRISPSLSQGLQTANLLATLLVISIHYTSKFANGVPVFLDANFYFQEFFTNNIARVAVPFFALSAGFFLFSGYQGPVSYRQILQKRRRTLLLPYVLASALIYTVIMLKTVVGGGLIDADPLLHLYNILVQPRAGQFWFLRDLILLVVLSPLVFYTVQKSKGLILAPLLVLWLLEIQLLPIAGKWYVLNTETVFFFSLGCYFALHPELPESFTGIRPAATWVLLVTWLGLSALRVYIDPVFSAWYRYDYTTLSLMIYKFSILIGIPALLAVSFGKRPAHPRVLFLSGFTFFAYMFHTEPLQDVLLRITAHLVSPAYAFYLTFPLATIAVFAGAWLCQQYMRPLYMLLTGNRGTDRVMDRLHVGR